MFCQDDHSLSSTLFPPMLWVCNGFSYDTFNKADKHGKTFLDRVQWLFRLVYNIVIRNNENKLAIPLLQNMGVLLIMSMPALIWFCLFSWSDGVANLFSLFRSFVDVQQRPERRCSIMVITTACHARGWRFAPLTRNMTLLSVKTWLSTLDTVYRCVFRMRL